MIPTATNSFAKTGNMVPQRSVDMKFDENSIAHIMSVLTDLYSDPEMAIIREYATNARDSHIESGQIRPIEVTTPTDLKPVFSVRDYGVGLSIDDIEQIYSKYGASTKRGTDDQTGMLGLGCKSGLTYSNQFVLIGVKNGVKSTVMVSRRDDGTGVMEVIDTCSTTEPNGVLVEIPAKRYNSLHRQAEFFFKFWETGSVLLNGKPVTSIMDTASLTTDNIFMVNGLGQDYIVMGGVPYGVGQTLYTEVCRGYNSFGIVAYVPMGAVNFTPSREKLHMTKRTTECIESIKADFVSNIKAAAKNAIESAKDHREALQRFGEWSRALSLRASDFKYGGLELPERFSARAALVFEPYARRYAMRSTSYLGPKEIGGALVIDTQGQQPKALSFTLRSKIRAYLEESDIRANLVIVIDDPQWDLWVETEKTTLSQIKAIRLNSGTARTKSAGTYELLNSAGAFETVTSLDNNKPIAYYSIVEYRNEYSFRSYTPITQIVRLNKNRWGKLVREYPNAVHFTAWAKSMYDAWRAGISEAEKQAYVISADSSTAWLRRFDPDRIDDPGFAGHVRAAKASRGHCIDIIAGQAYARLAGVDFAVPAPIVNPILVVNNYPLTRLLERVYNVDNNMIEEMYTYINNKYALEASK